MGGKARSEKRRSGFPAWGRGEARELPGRESGRSVFMGEPAPDFVLAQFEMASSVFCMDFAMTFSIFFMVDMNVPASPVSPAVIVPSMPLQL